MKQTIFFFLSFFWIAITGIKAQPIEDITYNSELEKKASEEFIFESKANFVDLFSCINHEINSTDKFEKRLNELVDKIDLTQYSSKKRSKLIKDVYESVHGEFLKKYTEKNFFSDIFEYGNYNCVSATALYAIIFEKLEIPYVIKEAPTHVYLVAYPNEDQIIVETTSPSFGYIEMKADFKKEYVNYLKENKIISESELRNSSIEELFNEYYFDELEIKLEELVGLQYYNDAILKIEEKQYQEAYNQLAKAQKFYASKKIDFLLITSTYLWLQSKDLSAEEKFSIICKTSELDLDNDDYLGAFNDVLREVLIEQGNVKKMDSLFLLYHDHFSEQEKLREMIDFAYYLERGRISYNQGKNREAMNFLENAVALRPDHLDAKSLFAHNIIRMYSNESFQIEYLDSLESKVERFPFLKENNLFGSFLCHNYLVAIYDYFDDNQGSKGVKVLQKFEEFYTEDFKENLNLELLGYSYIEASKYYFRQGNMAKVKETLERALVFDPKNKEAQTRLNNYF